MFQLGGYQCRLREAIDRELQADRERAQKLEQELQAAQKALADEKSTSAKQEQHLVQLAEREFELIKTVSQLEKEKEAETEKFNKSGHLLREAKAKIDRYKAALQALTEKGKAAEAEAQTKTQELEAEKARSEELAARITALEGESKAKDLHYQLALKEERVQAIGAFKVSDEYLDAIAEEFGKGIEWVRGKAASEGINLPRYEDQL